MPLTSKKAILTLSLILPFWVLSVVPAIAHTALVASVPAADEVFSDISDLPQSLELTFNEPLLVIEGKRVNYMTLHDPFGVEIPLGPNIVDGATLSSPLLNLKKLADQNRATSGEYHLTYRVAGQDGHVITGELHFSLMVSNAIKVESAPAVQESLEADSVTRVEEISLVTLIGAVAFSMLVIYIRAGRGSSS